MQSIKTIGSTPEVECSSFPLVAKGLQEQWLISQFGISNGIFIV